MKPVPRCLYYKEHRDLDYFLEGPDSKLNEFIYEIILDVRVENDYRPDLDLDTVSIFNEAYAQCIRIANDKHPEQNFNKDYIEDICDHVEYECEVHLILCVIYLIFSLQENNPKNIKYAIKSIEQYVGRYIDYFPDFRRRINEYKENVDLPFGDETLFKTDFTPHPDIDKLDNVDWYYPTTGFDKESIQMLLRFCTKTKSERHAVMSAICRGYDKCWEENLKNDDDDLPF